jgi:[ribosomal protein S18]-alanine N-acetyltransferase
MYFRSRLKIDNWALMMEFQNRTPSNPLTSVEKELIAEFLVHELGEFGDPKNDVLNCLDYAMNSDGAGGLVVLAVDQQELIGVIVLNQTGMSGYIPEHILVYFAVKQEKRRQGLGKEMINHLLSNIRGSIALHVEPQNPAIRLYEEFGFSSKYLEMRLNRG